MLYDEQSGQIVCPETEPLLLQLPGTLPFAEVKAHTATALEEMIHRLSDPNLQDDDRSMNNDSGESSNDGNTALRQQQLQR